MKRVTALLSGLLFGLGLSVAGMTDPRVVTGFLDVTGQWDPRLLLVLATALAVTIPLFRVVLKRTRPVCAPRFHLPASQGLDRQLIVGSALFGTGWGIAGYCPGAAVAAVAGTSAEIWIFLPAMTLGLMIHAGMDMMRSPAAAATERPPLS